MGAKKFQNLFAKSGNNNPLMELAAQNGANKKGRVQRQNNTYEDKRIAEKLIDSIGNKLKDPDMAKKAAQIIEDMINEQAGRKK